MNQKLFIRASILVVVQLLLAVEASVAGQKGQVLKFTDGQERPVVDNVYEDVASIDIVEREFDANVISVGRANKLDDRLLDKLKVQSSNIYNQV